VLKISDKAHTLPLMPSWGDPKNSILCMILRITLDINRKSKKYQASRGRYAVAELLVFLAI